MTHTTARLLSLLILAVFAGLAWHFAAAQSLWTDETTQLSGLSLPFKDQIHWLMGGANPIPGVPPDRMPPLSYWAGNLWSALFGLSEQSMRLMGIVACLSAAPAIWLSARRLCESDPLPAVVVLALVFLSPGVITEAVEIRAYPLFFACAAWSIWAFIAALNNSDPRRLLILSICCLSAIYTHFFGIVMAGLLWLTLLLARRREAGRVIVGGVATLVASAGLYPFVRAALQVTGDGPMQDLAIGDALRDTVRLGFRLMFHGSHLASQIMLIFALLAVAGLLILAVWLARRGGAWLFLPAALAFTILPILSLSVSGFDVLAPHYNLWLVPLFALALVPAFGPGRWQPVGLGLSGILILSHLVADSRLVLQPNLFTHGPADWVAEVIEDPVRTIVVHDGAGDWATSYFALYYRFEGRLAQVLRQSGQPDRQILPSEPLRPVARGFVETFPTVVYLRAQTRTSRELAEIARHKGGCTIPPMLAEIPSMTRCAYSSAVMQVVALPGEP